MQCPDSYSNGLQQPVWLPFSANGRCYPGKSGLVSAQSNYHLLSLGGIILEISFQKIKEWEMRINIPERV